MNSFPEYLDLSLCGGYSEQKRQQQSRTSTWVKEPEISQTERKRVNYLASLTEVIHGLKTLLAQAYQTFMQT